MGSKRRELEARWAAAGRVLADVDPERFDRLLGLAERAVRARIDAGDVLAMIAARGADPSAAN